MKKTAARTRRAGKHYRRLEPLQALRRLREEAGLTQRELAGQARIATGYLLQIEVGRRDPSLAVLKCLAAALGVKPGALLD
jgi:transcriptional regulator with XRE-family HTH domain